MIYCSIHIEEIYLSVKQHTETHIVKNYDETK